MSIKQGLVGLFVSVVLMLGTGCAVNRSDATVDPSADLGSIKTIFVTKASGDGRGVDVLIADRLKTMGYNVTTGMSPPASVDAVVSYEDKWMWDITMYMLELTVILRDPRDDFPLASGNSYHTSLTRKSPKEMVDEVLSNIFNKGLTND